MSHAWHGLLQRPGRAFVVLGAACIFALHWTTRQCADGTAKTASVRLHQAQAVSIAATPPLGRPLNLPRSKLDAPMIPLMTPAEQMTLQWYTSRAKTYAEYGSGASTVGAALMAGRSLSIDNHAPWCAHMQARLDVQFWSSNNKLQYECVDTGPTGEAGIPVDVDDPALKAKSIDYIAAIARFNESRVDVILVDGRFRVACALKSLEYVSDGSVVLIHDFFDRSPIYDAVLKYYDIVDRADTLVVLSRKKVVEWAQARLDTEQYAGDYR